MLPPAVTVIIPVKNAELYIEQALISILSESVIPFEILVIDDHCEDRSIRIVKEVSDSRIKIIQGKGQGISLALNLGLEQAQGEIIMRCDADDYYPKTRIQQQYHFLSENKQFSAVCGSFATVDPKGNLVSPLNCGQEAIEITQELHQGMTRTHLGTFAIRASAIDKIGGFRDYFQSAEDIDFQLRLSEQGRIWYQPKIWYYYRLHDTSMTHTSTSGKREFFDQIARKFQQQRQTEEDDLQKGNPPPLPKDFVQSSKIKSSSEHIQGMLIGTAWQKHQKGYYLQAIKTGIRAVATQPNQWKIWRSLMALLLKRPQKK